MSKPLLYSRECPVTDKIVSDVQTGETVEEVVTDAVEAEEKRPEEIKEKGGWI